jgi:hypothetical protein
MKLVLTALLLSLSPALVLGQSLADVAQKEKERRQKNQEKGVKPRVVTDEELKAGEGKLANDPSKPGMYQAATESPSGGVASGGGAEKTEQAEPAGEAAWRGRMADARAKVEAARKKHEAFSQMWLVPDGSYYVNKKTGERIQSVEQLQAMTAAAKAELDAAEKAVEDLELEARRASVPPGWLR